MDIPFIFRGPDFWHQQSIGWGGLTSDLVKHFWRISIISRWSSASGIPASWTRWDWGRWGPSTSASTSSDRGGGTAPPCRRASTTRSTWSRPTWAARSSASPAWRGCSSLACRLCPAAPSTRSSPWCRTPGCTPGTPSPPSTPCPTSTTSRRGRERAGTAGTWGGETGREGAEKVSWNFS